MKLQFPLLNYLSKNCRFFQLSRMWLHVCLLFVWVAVGALLRLTNLAAKPPWNDEFATVVFSLGNSFRTVPIDRAIALDTLLQPLRVNPAAGTHDVIAHLMRESTHPPVYFVLTHWWMKLFPTTDVASFWAARSLSVVFGVAAIPAMFGCGWLVFRSLLVGQIAAALMAVSPYGIYQAQEARHYSLAILIMIASLCCLVKALRNVQRHSLLPIRVSLSWVFVNSLGVAIHYFFTLALGAKALVLLRFWLKTPQKSAVSAWRRIGAIAAGTVFGILVWIPAWRSVPDHQVTQWIFADNSSNNVLGVLARLFAWIVTMIMLLPIEGTNQAVAIACGGILIVLMIWVLHILRQGIEIQLQSAQIQHETKVLVAYFLAAIAVLFTITFSFGADLTIAARYQFFYFPVVILLLASTLAICWNSDNLISQAELAGNLPQQKLLYSLKSQGKKFVILVFIMGLVGSLSVIYNFAYQKPDRPDLLIPIIQQASQVPTLIATAHFTHEQIGEMIGLALEFKRGDYKAKTPNTPLFLLAHLQPNSQTSTDTLKKTVAQLPKPLDLWVVNFFPLAEPAVASCTLDTQQRPKMNGYKYRLYHCL